MTRVDAAADFRTVFRRHAAGVAVITAPGPAGFTATSLASVSADPPLLSFNIALTASSWPAVEAARHVGVHVLSHRQAELAALFALSGADRFGPGTNWSEGPYGVPVLAGCAGWLAAEVEQRVPAGDHVIVVARVLHAVAAPYPDAPLVRHDGDYLR